MSRPLGSKNKSHKSEGNGDEQPLRNTCDAAELRSFINRIEEVNANIKEYSDDRRDIFKEFKEKGYLVATLRTIIKRRAMDPDKRNILDATLEQQILQFVLINVKQRKLNPRFTSGVFASYMDRDRHVIDILGRRNLGGVLMNHRFRRRP